MDIRVIKTALIKWKELHFIQPDNFKEIVDVDLSALKNSIIKNNFAQPFYVWHDEANNIIYCLDGKHRVDVLIDLINENYDVPEELPATFIRCKNKQEAAKLVLIYSSIYAKVRNTGLFDFIQLYNLNFSDLKEIVRLPELNMEQFEQMNFGEIENFIAEPKNKPATIKITFQNEKDLEKAKNEIELILEKYEGSFLSVSCGEI